MTIHDTASHSPRLPDSAAASAPTTPAAVLRGAMPPAKRFWPAVASGFASEASAVALLAVSAWLIVRASEQPLVMYITAAVVGVRLFALTRAAFRYLERVSGHDAALRQLATTRTDLVRRLIPLAPDGLQRTRRGSVLGALVDDVDELQNLPLRVVEPLLASATVALGGVVLVAFVSWPAALTLLGCLIVAALVSTLWGWIAGGRAERSLAPLRATLSDAVTDHLGSLDVLIAYGAEADSRARIAAADHALRRAATQRAAAQAATGAIVSLLAGVASILALIVTAPNVAATGGPALAVVVLVPMAVFEVFASVPLAASSWRQVHASATRIAEALPASPPAGLVRTDVSPTGDAPALGSGADAGIRLRGLSAHWPGASNASLHDIDLDVRPGEKILVVGTSGAGKTTLAHTLVRFLDSTGTYEIGGVPVSSLAPDDLRLTVGLCEQHPHLFDEDIRQNIIFARDTATDDELLAVLERVGLGDWVTERGGLDARVGERGALVSGGQAQRIALARGLLRDFPVLILDEPTAGVDPAAADALVTDLLGAVDAGRAVVLISHTSVPAGLIDRTVRLDHGRLDGGVA